MEFDEELHLQDVRHTGDTGYCWRCDGLTTSDAIVLQVERLGSLPYVALEPER
jgi:hypothetical protein